MRRKINLIILCIFVVSSMFVFTSCYAEEIRDVKENASGVAIKYMNEKYGENYKKRDIKSIEVDEGYYVFSSGPNGRADVIFKDGSIVYYNTNSMTLSDNRDIESLRADLLKYIDDHAISDVYTIDEFAVGQYYISAGRLIDSTAEGLGKDLRYDGDLEKFLNDTTDLSINLRINWRSDDDNYNYVDANLDFVKLFENAFTGMSVRINSTVIRTAPYDAGLVEKNDLGYYTNGFPDLRSFVKVLSAVDAYYNHGENASESDGWVYDESYPSFVEIEPGLQVSSQLNDLRLTDASQIDFQAFRAEDGGMPPEIETYLEDNFSANSEIPLNLDDVKSLIDGPGALQEEPNLFVLSYNKELSDMHNIYWTDWMVVKIDKNTFAGGILKQGYKMCTLAFLPNGPITIDVQYEDSYYEDDDTLFFQKENRQLLMLVND